jgi:hypothetical protein
MPRSLECSLQAGKALSQIADRVTAVSAWVLAWLGVVCLLLSLGLDTSAHPHPQVANRSPRSLVSLSSHRILPGTSTKFTRSRASPHAHFFPLGLFLSGDDVCPPGPPWLDFRGPPGSGHGLSAMLGCWLSQQPQKSTSKLCISPELSEISGTNIPNSKTRAFVTGSN